MRKIVRQVAVNLPMQIFKEGNEFIAYCPALDISTSASSLKEVQKMFSELVHIFIDEIIAMGTFDKVLTQCGWKKVAKKWEPPRTEFITESQQEFTVPCPI